MNNLAVAAAPAFPDIPELALSVRQPWPWAILNAGKDIENRDWRTTRRGSFALHAGKGMSLAEYRDFIDTLAFNRPDLDAPGIEELQRGGIVGVVDIVDCVSQSDSKWFFGTFGFVLANARPVEFIPVRGELGLFNWRRNL